MRSTSVVVGTATESDDVLTIHSKVKQFLRLCINEASATLNLVSTGVVQPLE